MAVDPDPPEAAEGQPTLGDAKKASGRKGAHTAAKHRAAVSTHVDSGVEVLTYRTLATKAPKLVQAMVHYFVQNLAMQTIAIRADEPGHEHDAELYGSIAEYYAEGLLTYVAVIISATQRLQSSRGRARSQRTSKCPKGGSLVRSNCAKATGYPFDPVF